MLLWAVSASVAQADAPEVEVGAIVVHFGHASPSVEMSHVNAAMPDGVLLLAPSGSKPLERRGFEGINPAPQPSRATAGFGVHH